MMDQIKEEAKAQAKAYIEGFRKKERVKDLGSRQNQMLKPTNNGTDSKKIKVIERVVKGQFKGFAEEAKQQVPEQVSKEETSKQTKAQI